MTPLNEVYWKCSFQTQQYPAQHKATKPAKVIQLVPCSVINLAFRNYRKESMAIRQWKSRSHKLPLRVLQSVAQTALPPIPYRTHFILVGIDYSSFQLARYGV